MPEMVLERASVLIPGSFLVAVRVDTHALILEASFVGSPASPETTVHRKGLSGLSPELLPTDLLLPLALLLRRRLCTRRRVQSTVSGFAL